VSVPRLEAIETESCRETRKYKKPRENGEGLFTRLSELNPAAKIRPAAGRVSRPKFLFFIKKNKVFCRKHWTNCDLKIWSIGFLVDIVLCGRHRSA